MVSNLSRAQMDYKCLKCDIANARKYVRPTSTLLSPGKERVHSKKSPSSFGLKMYSDALNRLKKKWLKTALTRQYAYFIFFTLKVWLVKSRNILFHYVSVSILCISFCLCSIRTFKLPMHFIYSSQKLFSDYKKI